MEDVIPVPGLRGSCTAAQALAAAGWIGHALEPGVQAWSIRTVDGCDALGRSIRWETRVDLPRRRSVAVISIGFVYDEETASWGDGVGAVCLEPFPAHGSELEKMATAGQVPDRRLQAVWRQQLRERRPLPDTFPDSSRLVAAVAPEAVRSAEARVTRRWGPAWEVETPGRTRHIRFDTFH